MLGVTTSVIINRLPSGRRSFGSIGSGRVDTRIAFMYGERRNMSTSSSGTAGPLAIEETPTNERQDESSGHSLKPWRNGRGCTFSEVLDWFRGRKPDQKRCPWVGLPCECEKFPWTNDGLIPKRCCEPLAALEPKKRGANFQYVKHLKSIRAYFKGH